MADIIIQARLRSVTNIPRDDVVNVFNFVGVSTTDFGNITEAVAHAYRDNLQNRLGGINQVTVSAYERSDPMPRPPQNVFIQAMDAYTVGPREVALCLSNYASRNLKRLRGRNYFGPFRQELLSERPQDNLRDNLINFGQTLNDIGDIGTNWVVWSPTNNNGQTITHISVDNEWDTMRSRGLRSTNRIGRDV